MQSKKESVLAHQASGGAEEGIKCTRVRMGRERGIKGGKVLRGVQTDLKEDGKRKI